MSGAIVCDHEGSYPEDEVAMLKMVERKDENN